MITALVAAAIAQGGPEAAEAAYEALYLREAKLQSIEGDLVSYRDGQETHRIHFEVQRPNLYRVDSGWSLVVGDGSTRWFYDVKANSYIKKPNTPDRTVIGELTGFEQFDSPDEIYYAFDGLKRVSFAGRPALEIAAHFPNSPEMPLRFYVDEATGWPLGFRNLGGKAALSVQRYENLKFNCRIRASDFTFRLRADAEPVAMPRYDLRSKMLPNGATAPDFSLNTPQGRDRRLSELLKGKKALVLDFWFRDCEPCRLELDRLSKNYARLRRDGIEVLAVNCADSAETVSRFIAQRGFKFPVVLDPGGGGSMAGLYGVQAFPTTYVLRPNRKVAASFVGFDEAGLEAALSKLAPRLGKAGDPHESAKPLTPNA